MRYKRLKDSNIEVSDTGTVRRISDSYEYSQSKDSSGYFGIEIAELSHITARQSIHRLVYATFNDMSIEELQKIANGKYVIDHIDGNRENNSINNLRLITNTQNRLNTKDYCIKLFYDTKNKKYILTDNLYRFAEEYGLARGHLRRVLDKNAKQHKGWIGIELKDMIYKELDFIIEVDNSYKKYFDTLSIPENKKPTKFNGIVYAMNRTTKEKYEFEYSDRHIFIENHGMQKGTNKILDCIRGRAKSYKDFIFSDSEIV